MNPLPTVSPLTAYSGADLCLLPPGLELIDSEHPRRQQVEQFIARRFLEVHGARVGVFMPELLTLSTADGRILAALGIRGAAGSCLFLEYYLDAPIEEMIAHRADPARAWPLRENIVEIGNLASIDRSASRQLFRVLAALLDARQFDWAVFTGCTSLQRMFRTLGIETVELGRALQSRLPVDQQTWGGYYEDSPRVVAGRVSRGCYLFAECGAAVSDRAVA